MQIFSNSCRSLSALGVAWRFHTENASIHPPDLRGRRLPRPRCIGCTHLPPRPVPGTRSLAPALGRSIRDVRRRRAPAQRDPGGSGPNGRRDVRREPRGGSGLRVLHPRRRLHRHALSRRRRLGRQQRLVPRLAPRAGGPRRPCLQARHRGNTPRTRRPRRVARARNCVAVRVLPVGTAARSLPCRRRDRAAHLSPHPTADNHDAAAAPFTAALSEDAWTARHIEFRRFPYASQSRPLPSRPLGEAWQIIEQLPLSRSAGRNFVELRQIFHQKVLLD